MANIALLGTVGVPANYGGFETLAENLVRYYGSKNFTGELTVYCSAKNYSYKHSRWGAASLRYFPLMANGFQSVLYDALCLLDCCMRRTNVILLLGVSGAILLPYVRLISKAHIVVNIDGIEWRREKWNSFAKWFLRLSEKVAVRSAHVIIADNEAIAEYVRVTYNKECQIIAYGGDHAVVTAPAENLSLKLPKRYALALCRIEPENNVAIILEAFFELEDQILVFIGNWNSSEYGRKLRQKYSSYSNLILCDPVYEAASLRAIRDKAWLYVHGHSAGGTNPSLVEMMHFGIPVVAHSCDFNRYTTEDSALYFRDSLELKNQVSSCDPKIISKIGSCMAEIARRRYTWEVVGHAYFNLLIRGTK